jgi:hypothetical protein
LKIEFGLRLQIYVWQQEDDYEWSMATGALFVRRVMAACSNSIISYSHLLSGLIKNLEQGETSMNGGQPVEGNRVLP